MLCSSQNGNKVKFRCLIDSSKHTSIAWFIYDDNYFGFPAKKWTSELQLSSHYANMEREEPNGE